MFEVNITTGFFGSAGVATFQCLGYRFAST